MVSLRTQVWPGSPVSQCGIACQATLVCSNVSRTARSATANRSALRYMGCDPLDDCDPNHGRGIGPPRGDSRKLLLRERDLLTRRHVAAGHGIAMRQVQGRDGVVGQQSLALLERGLRLHGVAGIEQ